MIPVARPDIDEAEVEAVTAVLRSGMLAGGPRVAELEERWAAFIGTRHAIAVSNGTVAEMCVFAGLGIETMAQRLRWEVVDEARFGDDRRLLLRPASDQGRA